MRGLRLPQAVVVIPLYRQGDHAARTLPVGLTCLARAPQARRGASAEEQAQIAAQRPRYRLTAKAAAL